MPSVGFDLLEIFGGELSGFLGVALEKSLNEVFGAFLHSDYAKMAVHVLVEEVFQLAIALSLFGAVSNEVGCVVLGIFGLLHVGLGEVFDGIGDDIIDLQANEFTNSTVTVEVGEASTLPTDFVGDLLPEGEIGELVGCD